MSSLGLGLAIQKSNIVGPLTPRDVSGNVLSLIATKANNGQVPVAGTTNFSNRSKNGVENDSTLVGTTGIVGSGFNKVSVINGKGDNIPYTNLTVDGDMNSATGWTSPNGTITASNNTLFLTADGSTEYHWFSRNLTISGSNKRCYCSAEAKVTSSVCSQLGNAIFNGVYANTIAFIMTPTINKVYKLSGIATISFSGTPKNEFSHNYFTPAAASGKVMEVQRLITINLTDNTFVIALETKLGRVLTVDECDRLFAFTTDSDNVVVDVQYALSLDGTNDYSTIANNASLDITSNEFVLASTFRIAVGAGTCYLVSKALDSLANSQYVLYYIAGVLYLRLNGTVVYTSPANFIAENTFYNVIIYRNSSGVITPYLNKIAYATANYTNALVTQPNVRLGALSSNVGGTTHTGFFKGDMVSQNIYQAPTLDINRIIKAEVNIAKDYLVIPPDVIAPGTLETYESPMYTGVNYAKNIWDLQNFDGRIYIGQGNAANTSPNPNAGPVQINAFRPEYNAIIREVDHTTGLPFLTNDEQLDKFKIVNGILRVPGTDSRGSAGEHYKYTGTGWISYPIPDQIHTYDIEEFDGKLFVSGDTYANRKDIKYTTDGGTTWLTGVDPDPGNFSRIYNLFQFQGELYMSPRISTFTFAGPDFGISKWDGTKFDLILEYQAMIPSTAFEELTNGFGKMARITVCNNTLLYLVGSIYNDHNYDPLPCIFYAPTISTAVRTNLPVAGYKPSDIIVRGITAYILTYKDNGDSTYTNKVYSTTDFINLTEIFSFTHESLARSLEEMDGDLYFGMGCLTSPVTATNGQLLRYRNLI